MPIANKYSSHKIVWWPEKLNALRAGCVTPPIYVRIKPTNACCHNCHFCIYKNQRCGMHGTMDDADSLSYDEVDRLLDDLKNMGTKVVTFSGGGEPLLHRDIVKIFNKTKANGLGLSLLTNGQLLSGGRAESLCDADWVRVSIDYCDAEAMHRSRGVPRSMFKSIEENLRLFSKNKSSECDLYVNFIITNTNQCDIVSSAKWLKGLGVENVRYSPVWTTNNDMYHNENMMQSVIAQIKTAKSLLEDGEFQISSSYRRHNLIRVCEKCYIMQIVPAIGADGYIYPCHNKSYDRDARIGSIKKRPFKDIWNSLETKRFFEKFNPVERCLQQCSNEAKNMFIQDLINNYGDAYI